jgi:hypothetical protein
LQCRTQFQDDIVVRSIVVVGAGELGGAVAQQIAAADIVSRVILVDASSGIAAGKALDIRQSGAVDGFATELSGTADETAVLGADAIVIADRAGGGEWSGDDAVALVRRVAHLNSRVPILCAGASHLGVIERGVREGGLDPRRLFGSAPEALRSAVIAVAALEAGCTPGEISLAIAGRPPSQVVVPWSDAAIGGRRAADVLSPHVIARLDARLPLLWPPGPLALGAAAARILRAAARRRHLVVSVFVGASHDQGERGGAGILPAMVDERGIAAMVPLALSGRDRVRLETALQR